MQRGTRATIDRGIAEERCPRSARGPQPPFVVRIWRSMCTCLARRDGCGTRATELIWLGVEETAGGERRRARSPLHCLRYNFVDRNVTLQKWLIATIQSLDFDDSGPLHFGMISHSSA